ncbi:hypothetical protein HQ571_06395 [Candidatus Kuenenbacteria bacterium]|nr:hypothetical protein [Candidatus Kuenenbacteria bacterium]
MKKNYLVTVRVEEFDYTEEATGGNINTYYEVPVSATSKKDAEEKAKEEVMKRNREGWDRARGIDHIPWIHSCQLVDTLEGIEYRILGDMFN